MGILITVLLSVFIFYIIAKDDVGASYSPEPRTPSTLSPKEAATMTSSEKSSFLDLIQGDDSSFDYHANVNALNSMTDQNQLLNEEILGVDSLIGFNPVFS